MADGNQPGAQQGTLPSLPLTPQQLQQLAAIAVQMAQQAGQSPSPAVQQLQQLIAQMARQSVAAASTQTQAPSLGTGTAGGAGMTGGTRYPSVQPLQQGQSALGNFSNAFTQGVGGSLGQQAGNSLPALLAQLFSSSGSANLGGSIGGYTAASGYGGMGFE